MTELVIAQSNDKILIDYNYNIEHVISSSSSQKINQPLLVLELFLRVNQDNTTGTDLSGRAIERVIVEMNTEEAIDFVNSL